MNFLVGSDHKFLLQVDSFMLGVSPLHQHGVRFSKHRLVEFQFQVDTFMFEVSSIDQHGSGFMMIYSDAIRHFAYLHHQISNSRSIRSCSRATTPHPTVSSTSSTASADISRSSRMSSRSSSLCSVSWELICGNKFGNTYDRIWELSWERKVYDAWMKCVHRNRNVQCSVRTVTR